MSLIILIGTNKLRGYIKSVSEVTAEEMREREREGALDPVNIYTPDITSLTCYEQVTALL